MTEREKSHLSVGTPAAGCVCVKGARHGHQDELEEADGAGDVLESGPERGATKSEVSRLKFFEVGLRVLRRGGRAARHLDARARASTSNIRPEATAIFGVHRAQTESGRPDGRRGSPGVAGDSARARPPRWRAAAAAAAPREPPEPNLGRKNFSREISLLVAPRSGPDSRTSPAPSERLLELILVPVTGTTPAQTSRVPRLRERRFHHVRRVQRVLRHDSSGRSRRGDGGRVGAGATSPRAPYCTGGRRHRERRGARSLPWAAALVQPLGASAPSGRLGSTEESGAARRSSTPRLTRGLAVLACGTHAFHAPTCFSRRLLPLQRWRSHLSGRYAVALSRPHAACRALRPWS